MIDLFEKFIHYFFCVRHELNNLVWTLLMTQITGKHIDDIINYN